MAVQSSRASESASRSQLAGCLTTPLIEEFPASLKSLDVASPDLLVF